MPLRHGLRFWQAALLCTLLQGIGPIKDKACTPACTSNKAAKAKAKAKASSERRLLIADCLIAAPM
jgi:hypothetical protein